MTDSPALTAAPDAVCPSADQRRKRTVAIDGPHPVDVHVGARLRLRRTFVGVTMEALAGAADLEFQQIQKYERASNRISASKLFLFASALDVPVSFFFDAMPLEVAATAPPPLPLWVIRGR